MTFPQYVKDLPITKYGDHVQGVEGENGYLASLAYVLDEGYYVNKERTGTGTIVAPFPVQLYFPNIKEKFPLFTTKEVSFNMLACEMLWFISGSTNTNDLEKIGSPAMKKMWDKWADDEGELGPVYGDKWRNWGTLTLTDKDYFTLDTIDQLKNAIFKIKNNPESRRIIVTAWDPGAIENMALPPCHMTFQFTCEPLEYGKYKLHLHLLQRSCDAFLGVVYNIAQYSLLLQMISMVTNTVPGDFTWTGVNYHIYQNHIDVVKEQLSRSPNLPPIVGLKDRLKITSEDGEVHEYDVIESIDDFTRDHIHLKAYNHHPKLEAEVSV